MQYALIVLVVLLLIVPIAVFVILIRVFYARKREIICSVTQLSRGECSEQDLIYRLVKAGIPSTTIFHDLYLATRQGYTQVDLVVPTNVGIFVFEVKDYSGWIFGNANHEKWTQVLAYGDEKHQFYNPIKQNAGHIEALRRSSAQLMHVPIYSIIVFYGTSEIKALSNVPANCWIVYPAQAVSLVKEIMSKASPAPYTDKREVMRILKSAVDNGSNEMVRTIQLQGAQEASCGKYKSTYSFVPRYFRYYNRYRY